MSRSNWTPVGEGSPETYRHVLVYIESHNIMTTAYLKQSSSFHGPEWAASFPQTKIPLVVLGVTHWMELPYPPDPTGAYTPEEYGIEDSSEESEAVATG